MNAGTPIAFFALSPMLVVFGTAVLSVLVEAFAPVAARYRAQLWLSLIGLAAGLVMVLIVARSHVNGGVTADATMSGAVVVDGPTLFLQGTIVVISMAAVAFMGERRLDRVWAPAQVARSGHGGTSVTVPGGEASDADLVADAFAPIASTIPGSAEELAAGRAGAITTEVFPLTLLAVGGMMVFPACGDLLTMFVALEVLSLPLYLLCGIARRRRLLSQEAALKYFLLGAFSSAIFLFGAAFAYGATGSLNLRTIGATVTEHGEHTLPLLALALLSVGLLFKVGAVPFGSWVPDVYQGAPTPVTAFMASATKVAAFGALLRVLYVGFPGLHETWKPLIWAVAIATMVIATLMAVTQSDVKRMLAYSSVSHVGFLLIGVAAFGDAGATATLVYLALYALSSFGSFAVLSVVRDDDGREYSDLTGWAGLGRRSPVVGAIVSIFLLALAGIPLTSGFIAKFAVFNAAGQAGGWALILVGVLCSAVAAYFYLRVIVSMFSTDAIDDAPAVPNPSLLTKIPVGVCAVATVVLGIVPQPLISLAESASHFLR
ncbi:MAG: NADH-quinone oxidoreductase subunit NuoN [Gordonia sp. (in: high G+C Gram-positive bacteria)]